MRLHQVAPGETLFSIAASYQLPLDALLAVNDKPSPAVRVGEVIFLPAAAKIGDVASFASGLRVTAKSGDSAGWNGTEGGGGNAAGEGVETGDVDNRSQQQQRVSQTIQPSQPGRQRLSQPSQPSNQHLSQEDAEIKVSQDFALKFREKPGGNYPGKYSAGPKAGQQRYGSGAQEGGKSRGGGGKDKGRKESRESSGRASKESLRSDGFGKGEEARRGGAVAGGGLQRIEVCEEREMTSAFASVGAPKIPYLDCTPAAAAPSRLAASAFRQQPQQLQLRRQQPQQLQMQQPGKKHGQQLRIAGGQVGGESLGNRHRSTFLGGSARQFTATVGQQQLLLPEGKLFVGAQHGGRWAVVLGVAVAVAAGGAALGGRVGALGGALGGAAGGAVGRALGGAAGATSSVQGGIGGGVGGLFAGGGHDASKASKQEGGAEGVGVNLTELKTDENQMSMENWEDRCVPDQGKAPLWVGEEAWSSEMTQSRKEAGSNEEASREEGGSQGEESREEGSRGEGSKDDGNSEEGSRGEGRSRAGERGREEGIREEDGNREEGLREEGIREEGSMGEGIGRVEVCAEGLPLEEVRNWSVEEAIAANVQVARKMGLQQA
ncbi:unnamed protein product [Closterium sp. Naga37s-1]|nr:unnamed protein product [Closterium sp. Naga37s-1]